MQNASKLVKWLNLNVGLNESHWQSDAIFLDFNLWFSFSPASIHPYPPFLSFFKIWIYFLISW